MTSSDSGEDFESADEDLDFDQTSKHHNIHHKRASSNDCDDKNQNLEKSEEKASSNVIQQLNSLKLNDESSKKHEDMVVSGSANIKYEENEVLKQSNKKTAISTSKKLGTKLTVNSKICDSYQATNENKSDSILLNQKDGEDAKIIEEIKPKQTPVARSTENKSEASKTANADTSGDGWEIEEEDGFEIPVALAKTSDGSILCAQEQISELDQVEFRPPKNQQSQGWGKWGGWGVSSLLASATGSVSTFSSQVTAGLSTVLETTVGAPDPESLALATIKEQNDQDVDKKTIEGATETEEDKMSASYGGFGSIVSGVSFLGSTVINRGLDTLETLGKKTMEVLQEGDPGLMKKRAMLFPNQDKPVLSQILKEAKEKAEHSDKEKEEKESARKVHFESLFDDFQGMVHLEALEMLSTQCELKLQSLLLSQSGPELLDLQETMSQVRDLCELPDEEDDMEILSRDQFVEEVTKCGKSLNVMTSVAKIIEVNDSVISRISELATETATAVNQAAISSLAEFTAAGMEFFHKSAELLLAKQLRNTADEAEHYTQLTNHMCTRVSAIANDFTQLLTKDDPIANSSLITNIFLEASNSSSYIRNACQLLVPILQVGAVTS